VLFYSSSLKLHWILLGFCFFGKIGSINFSQQVCGRLVPEQPESWSEAERSWVLKGNGKAVTVLRFYGRGFRGAGTAVGRIPRPCILYCLILEGFPETSLIFREVFCGE